MEDRELKGLVRPHQQVEGASHLYKPVSPFPCREWHSVGDDAPFAQIVFADLPGGIGFAG